VPTSPRFAWLKRNCTVVLLIDAGIDEARGFGVTAHHQAEGGGNVFRADVQVAARWRSIITRSSGLVSLSVVSASNDSEVFGTDCATIGIIGERFQIRTAQDEVDIPTPLPILNDGALRTGHAADRCIWRRGAQLLHDIAL